MKKMLAMLLALVTLLAAIPVTASAAEAAPVEAIVPEGDYPASATLMGDPCVPPIDDQGYIGCCVSEAVTYMQFTNSVARYMQSLGHTEWVPNDGSKYGDDRYIFSPKWTYNYSGSGTLWVYDILMTMGCLPQTQSKFYKMSNNGSDYYSGSRYTGGRWIKTYYTKTTSWDVTPGLMEQALNYRLKRLDRVETRDVAGGQVSNSKAGQALLTKIKAAIDTGNVVMTGGMSGQWTYGKLSKGGTLGVTGDACVYGALSSGGGGHQVSIVGYDDDIEFTIGGVTMKGGLQVANSWGQNWQNDGCVWFMYDGLNLVSEFAGQCDALVSANRTYSLDQYVFTDWRTDIEIGQPDLIVTAEVTTADREAAKLLLTRTDKNGETATYQPKIFYYGDLGYHESYDNDGYFNYAGVDGGGAVTASFAFSYEDLYEKLPTGKTVNDYVWGFILQVEQGHTATVGEIALKYKGTTLSSFTADKVVTAGDSFPAKAYFSCADDCYIITDGSPLYTIQTVVGSNPVPRGGSYSFTVNPAFGYTADFMVVTANGEVITPVDGVYTLENVTSGVLVSAQNVVEDVREQPFSPKMYNNDGWEYFGNQYVMVVEISNAELDPEVYANADNLGSDAYPYWFRLTDKATGMSFYMQPASVYRFSGSTLYRLPIVPAGFTAIANRQYNFTLDVVYAGRALYTGDFSTVCSYDSTVNAGEIHTVTYFVDGGIFATDAYPVGRPVIVREAADRHGYTCEWVGDPIPAVMDGSDPDVDAVYTFSYYEISWQVAKGTIVTRVAPGETPTFIGDLSKPSASSKLSYEFDGWDKEIVPATEDTTYVANYKEVKAKFTITWVVGTGSYEEVYEYGDTPIFKGDTSKPSDAQYDYTFDGWDKTIRAATKNATYTAKYIATERTTIFGDLNGDGTLSIGDVTVLLVRLSQGDRSAEFDVNGDGTVSVADVSALLRMLVK